MSKLTKILVTCLFPIAACAQSQGEDVSLGSSGTQLFGYVNEAETNLASGFGKKNFIATTRTGRVLVQTSHPQTITTTTPTINNATSTTLVSASATRKYLLIQNNSAANIMISLSGATLTGIVPSATNIGFVLIPGASYEASPSAVPTSAITVYQSSGGAINTVVVAVG